MSAESLKVAAIEDLLVRLKLNERGWVVVDHWEADRFATGIASKRDQRRLVYISVFGSKPGEYSYECEEPSMDPEEVYVATCSGDGIAFEELLRVVEKHLERRAG
jgi:hypothetical protein